MVKTWLEETDPPWSEPPKNLEKKTNPGFVISGIWFFDDAIDLLIVYVGGVFVPWVLVEYSLREVKPSIRVEGFRKLSGVPH